MNISEIKQLPNVDGWIDCNAQIKEVKEIKQRTKSNLSKTPGQQYNVQKLVIQDNTDIISLWAYATQQFVPGQNIEVHGMVKEYQGKRYLDYCDIKTNTNTYQAPQNAPQAPPQPAQPTNSPQPAPQDKKEPDWDAKDLRMARMNSLTNSTKLICLMAEANKDIDITGKDREGLVNLVTQTADIILHYIYNGLAKKQAPNQSAQNEPTKDLFCDGCNNLREDCVCDPKY